MESSPPVKRTRSRRVSQVIISDDSCDEDEDVRTRKRKTLKKNSIGDLSYIESDDDFSPPRKVFATKTKAKISPRKRQTSKASVKDKPAAKRPKLNQSEPIDDTDGCSLSTAINKKNTKPPKAKPHAITKNNPSTLPISTSLTKSGLQSWTEPQLLAEIQNLDFQTSQNIIKLFNDDNTIPFICRYRKELIGDMTPDMLRDIKISYNHVLNIKARASTIIKTLEKDGLLNEEIQSNILCAKSLDELDHLYAPYKPASKGSLFERAKAVGLQHPAEQILHGRVQEVNIQALCDTRVEGIETSEKVVNGIQHIIAHIVSKDTRVLEEIRRLVPFHRIMLQSKYVPLKETSARAKANKNDEKTNKPVDANKFETYFDFKNAIKFVKPHQVLAINRGESLKVLSVKIDIPDAFKNDFSEFVRKVFLRTGIMSQQRQTMFQSSFEEAYTKKLQPLIGRQIRGDLTKTAECASIEVFATNLKQLLLMSPVKGEPIIGIDPGFTNGCKVALISECANVLATDVIYPHTQRANYRMYGERLADMMSKHKCRIIALGNGTACRETERWISDMFKDGVLDSEVIQYSIVTEQGASIYSCGEVARKEFPDLDVNLISAVSIARRLNDPLCEFVKVEPKHLGVGMYQHDINEKLLTESLNEVVMECVSFVGVDINTASVALLRHVAGLTAVRAENIIKHRTEKGPFKSREELKKVKQIGDKTFIQCAGFVRIEPLTAGIDKYNLLDSTWVHPESYDIAKRIITSSGLTVTQIGSAICIAKVKEFEQKNPLHALAKDMSKPEERIKSVLDALQRELLRDYRADFDKKPLFKQGITKMTDLKEGTVVTGAITNITHFGCFVDIGVEKDGLIHVSQLGGMKPNIGDRIEATVTQVDVGRGRIQLKLQKIC